MRSPLLPELTLLQGSKYPSWGCSRPRPFLVRTHPVQCAPTLGALPLTEVRLAWLLPSLQGQPAVGQR